MSTTSGRRRYATDLTDAQWQRLEPLLVREAGPGRPPTLDLREIVNALLYLKQAGCAWRLLPHDFPNWTSVRYYFDQWTVDGTWEALNTAFREQVRQRAGRAAQPTAGLLDSQSVKTAEASLEAAWNGHKRHRGRKRHVLVDTTGCLLGVLVLAGSSSDQLGALLLLGLYAACYPLLAKLWTDPASGGDMPAPVHAQHGIAVEVGEKPADQRGFAVLPQRWMVERSLAWWSRGRRLKRDYERDPAYSESWLYLASIHRMLRHLAPDPTAVQPYKRREAA
jgi:putative transposase